MNILLRAIHLVILFLLGLGVITLFAHVTGRVLAFYFPL